jgi:hypothetical protein
MLEYSEISSAAGRDWPDTGEVISPAGPRASVAARFDGRAAGLSRYVLEVSFSL